MTKITKLNDKCHCLIKWVRGKLKWKEKTSHRKRTIFGWFLFALPLVLPVKGGDLEAIRSHQAGIYNS